MSGGTSGISLPSGSVATMDTTVRDGGAFESSTEILTAIDVRVAPRSSVARAVKLYWPAGTSFQSNSCEIGVPFVGATTKVIIDSPILLLFAKNSTFGTQPSRSTVSATIWISAGALNSVPFDGWTMCKIGGRFVGA